MADNLIDAVERLEQLSARFERILYGDPPARPSGLIAEFEGLRHEVHGLREDMQRLKARRPNKWLWIAGYLTFAASVTFGTIGLINTMEHHDVLGIPASLALWLAAVSALGALLMFLGGFGWLDQA